MPVMSFDLQDGKPPVSFSINNEGAERFMNFMAECQAIRDSRQPDSGRDAALPALLAMPAFMRRRIDQAVQDAVFPKGMGVHAGKAHVHASDVIRMLAIIDAAMAAQQGEKQ